MLTLFKPCRKGTDLKRYSELWSTVFDNFPFSDRQKKFLANFNLWYRCLDERDDYNAKRKKIKSIPMLGENVDYSSRTINLDGVVPRRQFVRVDDMPLRLTSIVSPGGVPVDALLLP